MDSFEDDPFEPSSSRDGKVEDQHVHDLLEGGWFFGKLLNAKPAKILGFNSDPSPNFVQENLSNKPNSQEPSCTRKVAGHLIHAPSFPPHIGREQEKVKEQEKGRSSPGVSKLNRQLSDLTSARKPTKLPPCSLEEKVASNFHQEEGGNVVIGQSPLPGLHRAPSLPIHVGMEDEREDEDEGDEIPMSRLILEAMPNSLHTSRPRRNAKGISQCSTMPKCRPPRSSTATDNMNTIRPWETSHGQPSPGNLKKTLSNLEAQEVQGFRDLGFSFTKEELNSSAAEVIPGFKGQGKNDQDQSKARRSSDLEALQVKTCATPIPIWAGKNSAEDMKTQLKFWARAVASNVR